MLPNPPIHTDASKGGRVGLLARVIGTRWAADRPHCKSPRGKLWLCLLRT
jgi:hypothetical protein